MPISLARASIEICGKWSSIICTIFFNLLLFQVSRNRPLVNAFLTSTIFPSKKLLHFRFHQYIGCLGSYDIHFRKDLFFCIKKGPYLILSYLNFIVLSSIQGVCSDLFFKHKLVWSLDSLDFFLVKSLSGQLPPPVS